MASTEQPSYSERGKIGARTRWGPPRRHKLADLTPEQRQKVADLVDASRKENAEKAGER